MKKLLLQMLLAHLVLASCKSSGKQRNAEAANDTAVSTAKDTGIVYKSDGLIVQRLSNHVYQHTSFLNTNSFGKVDCNGMIVVNKSEAIVFDTPADNESSKELIRFVQKTLGATINGVIPTHFHEDCVGGLESFHKADVPVFASGRTIKLLQQKARHFSKPFRVFDDSLTLYAGDKAVHAVYFGAGHTTDNVIGYFANDSVLFGGCLIKAVGAGKGNLEDANVHEWSRTVSRLQQNYPQVRIVIPGHGSRGGADLLHYTIKLFE